MNHQAQKYTQNLKITGTLHNEWKRNNLLGDFQFFLEVFNGPIYRRKTKTSLGSEVFLHRNNDIWRIGPNYDGHGAGNCWLFIKSKASEPLYILDDQKETKENWHEHKSGVSGSRWFSVKNLKIRDANHVEKSKPNKQRIIQPMPKPPMNKNDGCSEEPIKYATPRCLRGIRRGNGRPFHDTANKKYVFTRNTIY